MHIVRFSLFEKKRKTTHSYKQDLYQDNLFVILKGSNYYLNKNEVGDVYIFSATIEV